MKKKPAQSRLKARGGRPKASGGSLKARGATVRIGENRDAQNCDRQDLTSELAAGKCYKVAVVSGRPKSGDRAANLLVQSTADGVEGNDGLGVGDETRCLKNVTRLTVHCNQGASVTYTLLECRCP